MFNIIGDQKGLFWSIVVVVVIFLATAASFVWWLF